MCCAAVRCLLCVRVGCKQHQTLFSFLFKTSLSTAAAAARRSQSQCSAELMVCCVSHSQHSTDWYQISSPASTNNNQTKNTFKEQNSCGCGCGLRHSSESHLWLQSHLLLLLLIRIGSGDCEIERREPHLCATAAACCRMSVNSDSLQSPVHVTRIIKQLSAAARRTLIHAVKQKCHQYPAVVAHEKHL